MTGNSIEIREMLPSDMEGLMRLKDSVGWNQTKADWKVFLSNKMNANLVVEKNKRVIASATAINYNNDVAWIGMVIVEKESRGQGISKLLLNELISMLRQKKCKSIKLDATPAGQPVYEKLGFVNEYTILRMTNSSVAKGSGSSLKVIPEKVKERDIPWIIDMDRVVFGADRDTLLKPLISNNYDMSWLLKQGNRVSGFILGREGTNFFQIGPATAENIPAARELITKSLISLANQAVVIDIPEYQSELINWLVSIGFTRQRHFVRMYLHTNPFPGDSKKQFLICGPEFG